MAADNQDIDRHSEEGSLSGHHDVYQDEPPQTNLARDDGTSQDEPSVLGEPGGNELEELEQTNQNDGSGDDMGHVEFTKIQPESIESLQNEEIGDIEQNIPPRKVHVGDTGEQNRQEELSRSDNPDSGSNQTANEGATMNEGKNYSSIIRFEFGTKEEGVDSAPDQLDIEEFTNPADLSVANRRVAPNRQQGEGAVPGNPNTSEDERRPGAYPVSGRAPGALPTWGRRLRRALTLHRSSRGGENWGDGMLEATRVTDARPVVFATSVQREEIDELSRARLIQRRSKRNQMIFVLVIFVLIGLVVGLVVGYANRPKKYDGDDTVENIDDLSASKQCRKRGYIAQNKAKINSRGKTFITDRLNITHQQREECSPQNLALMWLAEEDEGVYDLRLNETDENALTKLKERYALTTFYFALYGDEWETSHMWLSKEDVCHWEGVRCQHYNSTTLIAAINLEDTGLNGTIPREFSTLTKLRVVKLSKNSIKGIEFDPMHTTDLHVLDLSHNDYGGSIPTTVGLYDKLISLNFGDNRITGTIPSEIGNLERLSFLFLGGNSLEGTIPTQIGSLEHLSQLVLYGNKLTGPIPSEIGSITGLEFLNLGGSDLNGTIPREISRLKNIHALLLSEGALSGPIPAELGKLDLRVLDLHGNKLTGTIPIELGDISRIEFLNLGSNELKGTLPSQLGKLEELKIFEARDNLLFGNVSEEMCDLIFLDEICVDKEVQNTICPRADCAYNSDEWQHSLPFTFDWS